MKEMQMKECAVLLALLLLVGCSKTNHFWGDREVLTNYDANCLWNIQVARDYTAQGRYELAREHFLLALASSDDPETRQLISRELKSVDTMIKTQC